MTVFEADKYDEQCISAEFYAALAAALGATDLETENRAGRMTIGDVRLCFRQGYGANAKRLTASAYAADKDASARAYRYGRPLKFPEATFDPTRPVDALARDIGKRLIEKSAPALAAIREMDASQQALTGALETQAAAIRRRHPALQVTVKDHEAQVYGSGVSARMSRDGSLYFDRISVGADKAARVLAILLEA